MVKLTDEETETLSYDDVAYLILNDEKKKIKIQDLFKKVIKVMGLPESEYEEGIGDFFELITTDKRFIILDKGYCDLKINHSTKVIIDDDDDEEYEMMNEEDMDTEDESEEENYDDDSIDDLDSDDDLDDLVIIDSEEENDGELM